MRLQPHQSHQQRKSSLQTTYPLHSGEHGTILYCMPVLLAATTKETGDPSRSSPGNSTSTICRDEYPQNAVENTDMAAINAILEESTPDERAETYKVSICKPVSMLPKPPDAPLAPGVPVQTDV